MKALLPEPAKEKALQRKLCLDARARLSPASREEASRRLSENLLVCLSRLSKSETGAATGARLSKPETGAATGTGLSESATGLEAHAKILKSEQKATILAYAAFGDEADPGLCVKALRQMGFRVAFPATMPGRQMLALVPLDTEEMLPDRYGIPTPCVHRSETVLPEEIAAVIVPCVGFDRLGRRLGHGAGYYDRYLVRCPNVPRVLAAFSVQELPEVAVGPYDLFMDYVVTEEGCWKTGSR